MPKQEGLKYLNDIQLDHVPEEFQWFKLMLQDERRTEVNLVITVTPENQKLNTLAKIVSITLSSHLNGCQG